MIQVNLFLEIMEVVTIKFSALNINFYAVVKIWLVKIVVGI